MSASNPSAGQDPRKGNPERDTTIADIVAEQIEAGYDVQADAATNPLADDPAGAPEAGNDTM